MGDRFWYPAWNSQEGVSEIVFRLAVIRLEPQRRFELGNRLRERISRANVAGDGLRIA